MSSHHDHEEDLEKVKKLLICKRYEQPPPSYFVYFSDRVMARLEAEELSEYSSWWQWLVERFDARPVMACIYGLTISGLLLAGFKISQLFDAEAGNAPAFGGPWLAITQGSTAILPGEFRHASYVDSDAPAYSYTSSLSPGFPSESPNLFHGNRLAAQPFSFSFVK